MGVGSPAWLRDNIQVQVFAAGSVRIGPDNWEGIRVVKASFWRLYANARDGAVLEWGRGETFTLEAGRISLIPAGLSLVSHSTQDVLHFYVHFDLIGLPPIALRQLFHRPVCLPRAEALEQIAREASEELAGSRGVTSITLQWRLKALLLEGLAQYVRTVPPEQQETCWQMARDLAPVLPALRAMEERLGDGLSNSELARLCGMSEDYFIRRFRECLGQTPGHFLAERRVTQAAQRLLFTKQTLEQIAQEAGFCDRAHLSRVFRAHKGASPAAYRRTGQV